MSHLAGAVLSWCVILTACTSVQYGQTDCSTLPSDTFWSGNVALQCQNIAGSKLKPHIAPRWLKCSKVTGNV